MSENPDIRYGRVLEAAGLAGHSAQRAIDEMLALSESGEWEKIDAGRFAGDYSGFIRSIPFGELRPSADQLSAFESLAHRFGASNRAIAESTGQTHPTVAGHLGKDLPPSDDGSSPDQGILGEPVLDNGKDLPPSDDGSSPDQGEQDSLTDESEEEPSPEPSKPEPKAKPTITLYTHEGVPVEYPEPQGKAQFNQTQGDGISWAAWSWNPMTGCLHGCRYCYAREIATSERTKASFPVGFTPLFHRERLGAPANTTIPAQHRDDPAWRRVFVCSMADLYGRWVPDEWVKRVHESMLASPQWSYLLLTKFPARYVGLDLPPRAWAGTSVDEQKRVRIAENAFRQVDGVAVKWLSLEPLLEPLEFSDLSMFDWVVIGAQTATRQPDGVVPAFQPPAEWVVRITAQAIEAGCKVHWKPNLQHNPGMRWLDEYPDPKGDPT